MNARISSPQKSPIDASARVRKVALLARGRVPVWRCGTSGLCWIRPTDIQDIGLAACYNDYAYNRVRSLGFDVVRGRYLNGLACRIQRCFGQARPETLSFLDIGCSNGEYMWAARAIGLRDVAGADVDTVALEKARAFGRVAASMNGFEQASFDIVQIKNVLSNIGEFTSFSSQAAGLLKPGGWLFLDVLNHGGLTSVLRRGAHRMGFPVRRYGVLRLPHVVNGFTRSAVRMLLQRLDLSCARLVTASPGAPDVPYYCGSVTSMVGWVSDRLGMGSMIIADAQKPKI